MTDQLANLRTRVTRDPESLDDRRALVEALLQAQMCKEACEHAQALVALLPNHAWTYELAARACEQSGDVLGARRMQRDARELMTESPLHPSRPKTEGGVRSSGNSSLTRLGAHGIDDIVGLATVKSHIRTISSHIQNARHARRRDPWQGGTLFYGPTGCGKRFSTTVIAHALGVDAWGIPGDSPEAGDLLNDMLRSGAGDKSVLVVERIDTAPDPIALESILHTAAVDYECAVLATATYPWNVPSNLMDQGRLDTVVLVLPPDSPARATYIKRHCPGIDDPTAEWLVSCTDGHSFEELLGLIRTVSPLPTIEELRNALRNNPPASTQWLSVAGHHALLNEATGLYDDLLNYFRSRQPRS